MAVMELEPISANANEQPALNKMQGVLSNGKGIPKLVGTNEDDCIELPKSVFKVLRQIVFLMMQGKTIFIVPEDKQLTTQEAADILGVSRPYLVKLLDQRKIPCIKVGMHHRIFFGDLMRYKRERGAEREKTLAEISQISQDLGLYD